MNTSPLCFIFLCSLKVHDKQGLKRAGVNLMGTNESLIEILGKVGEKFYPQLFILKAEKADLFFW